MSLVTLQRISSHYQAEDALVDEAIDSFKLKDLPSFATMDFQSVTSKAGSLVIEGEWDSKHGHFYTPTVTIDPKTGEATASIHHFFAYTGTTHKAELDPKKTVELLTETLKRVDAGELAASAKARSDLTAALRAAKDLV